MLSDTAYEAEMRSGSIRFDPELTDEQYQPASVDLRLGKDFLLYARHGEVVTLHDAKYKSSTLIPQHCEYAFDLYPGQFVLGTTLERIALDNTVVGFVEGRTSIGRLGVSVHATARVIDPGFSGTLTLHLYNLQPNPVRLIPGMRICQIVFAKVQASTRAYSGKYQNQQGPQESLAERDVYATKEENFY